MPTERDYIYEVETKISELNENNFLKPYAYQTLFSEIVDKHLNKINVNIDTTMKYNLAWVLMSISFELVNPVQGCTKLYASTWHSERKGPFFRREIVVKEESGRLMFHGSTFSVLLDIDKRTIYRKKELPFEISAPIEDFTIQANTSFKTDAEYKLIERRKVLNSYIDRLGHVNNSRYGEFAYDAFTDEERRNLSKLKRMDINFISELRINDTFSILKAYENNKIFVRGQNDEKGSISFDVRFEFD